MDYWISIEQETVFCFKWKKSIWQDVKSGIPQGSVLGPLSYPTLGWFSMMCFLNCNGTVVSLVLLTNIIDCTIRVFYYYLFVCAWEVLFSLSAGVKDTPMKSRYIVTFYLKDGYCVVNRCVYDLLCFLWMSG